MSFMNEMFTGKRWLIYGSIVGASLCALLIYLSELLPAQTRLSFGLPVGFALAVGLGMIGGIVGGLIGSLIAGALAGEDIFLNIGQSLGIGLTNGFVTGTLIGVLLEVIHRWLPGNAALYSVLVVCGFVVTMTILVAVVKRRR